MKEMKIHSPSLPGPENVKRFQLGNGPVLLCLNNPNSSSFYMLGLLKAASKFEAREKTGLANFTACMLMRGTENRDFNEIHQLLESAGASLNFNASTQNTWFSGRALAEDLGMMIELAADCLIHPIFPVDYMERMRAQILTSLAIREQDTEEMASLIFDKTLFPNHPYGEPVDGYPKTLQTITQADLTDFHHSLFTPKDMILAVVGGVSAEKTLEQVERFFGAWSSRGAMEPADLPPVTKPEKTVRQHVEIPGKSQTDLIMGCQGPARPSDDYLPIHLGNDILGQFGMMGRIGESVRANSGLAYFASSNLNSWMDCGVWEVSAGVNPSNTEKAIELILRELKKFTSQPVRAEELQDSKSHLVGRLALSLESNAGLANAIMGMEHFHLGMDYYLRYADLINAITAEQIMRSAQKYMDLNKIAIISSGTSNFKGKQ